jgi:hypothetical protein
MMELTTLQRPDQKKLDELRRISGTMNCAESPLTNSENALVLECAKVMHVSKEEKLQEVINFIIAKGGNDQREQSHPIYACK